MAKLYDALINFKHKEPNAPALYYMGKTISFGKLVKNIEVTEHKLTGLGVRADNVVTVCMPNVPEAIYVFYALNKLGAIIHLVHPLTPAATLSKYMKAANSSLLITITDLMPALESLSAEYRIVYSHPARSLGALAVFAYNLKNGKYTTHTRRLFDLHKICEGKLIEKAERKSEAGIYLHSGGTSGESKLIKLSDDAINALSMRSDRILGKDDIVGTYMLGALPMFHGFGLAMGVHAILIFGGVSVLMPKFKAKAAVSLIAKNKLNYIIGVPNLFNALLNQPKFKGKILKNIYVSYVGGDCAPSELIKRYDERLAQAGASSRLYEGYGLTETVTVCTVNTFAHHREGSVGKPLDGLDVIVTEPNGIKPLAPNQIGEIAVSGDTLMLGYLDDEAENDAVFFELNDKRYVRTGDMGYIDQDGFVFFKQRIKRIIKIAGISIYPAEIENTVLAIDNIAEACAVDYMENGKTYIALFVCPDANEDAIYSKIDAELMPYCRPKKIIKLPMLPRTPVMKVDINKLKDML